MVYTERVVVLVDMDCFYCQVEEGMDPSLKGKPIAVVQYNAWRGGGIIAVNYPARERGVTRHMRGNEAKQKCPEIILARVPEVRGKADLSRYREAGKRVADVLQMFTPILERASVDEAYLDITEVVKRRMVTDLDKIHINHLQNTFVVGYETQDFIYNVTRDGDYSESNRKLALGGLIAEEIRAEVFKKTGYKCSAGIAHNRILAKLVCGLHKPNKQTILPHESVAKLYQDLPVKKIPGLGGKFGTAIEEQLRISKMAELIQFTEKQLSKVFEEKTAKWLYNIARGIDYEPVTPRLVSKSIGCCKNFPGKGALLAAESVKHWVGELTAELSERLEKDATENNRRAKQVTLNFSQPISGKDVSNSRTLSLNSYDQPKIYQTCLEAVKKYCLKSDGSYNITHLGFSAGNFMENNKNTTISELFQNMREMQKPEIKTSLITTEKIDVPYTEPNNLNVDETVESFYEDNVSVYSAETDELNEDTSGLIYYDDVYSGSFATRPILHQPSLNESISSLKSANIEIALESVDCNNDLLSNRATSTSFFSKYFEHYNTDSCSSSPVERNFDTSKILEDSQCSEENMFEDYSKETQSVSPVKRQTETKQVLDSSEICPECKKTIPVSEFASHLDYHFALSIVKEEAHLYRPVPNSTSSSKKSPKESTSQVKRSSTKKKITDIKPIHAYLQTDELNEENSELCSECNKRIKLDDIVTHIDYHAAKKLHLEINSKPSFIADKNDKNKSCNKEKGRKKKNEKTVGTIHSFFNANGV